MNELVKRGVRLTTIGFLMVVFFGATGAKMPQFSGDFLNLLTVVGAVITVWQIVSSAVDKMQSELAGRDRIHDEQISKIWVKVEANATAIDHHAGIYGHNGTVEEMARLKDRLAQVEAICAVNSQLGTILLRVEELERTAKST
ncbi:hypothetical protein [Aulosira sp. FACHB-615]|uniref:hypothetical protein n=1 Tax=Aulosira sp. FACHB-615 TaxID=2692777 RepID=UPI00168233A0|nr:hypothetical protein [Aulosira sp. FACHB-615]MBD2492607.1 hypothetical protein [Aulosira sp. FACHB-615]